MADPAGEALNRGLIQRGWTEGTFVVREDGPPIGAWRNYAAVRTTPARTLTDAWVGPNAGHDASEVILEGQPLQRGQLRKLLAQPGRRRPVAQVVIRTSGHGRGIGDAEAGDFMGLPVELERSLHAPRIEEGPHGPRFAFFARMHAGGYVRIRVDLDGEGPVELMLEPPPIR